MPSELSGRATGELIVSRGAIGVVVLSAALAACVPVPSPIAQRDGAGQSDTLAPAADSAQDAGPSVLVTCDEGSSRCTQPFCDQVPIPPGDFLMGSDEQPTWTPYTGFDGLKQLGDETPRHLVRLNAFCIDQYEVSYQRYWACVMAGVCTRTGHAYMTKPSESHDHVEVGHYPPRCDNSAAILTHCQHLAVNCKTYQQAETYCRWIGRRLCSEAEWERAGSGPGPAKQTYPWGEGAGPREVANLPFSHVGTTAYIERVDARPLGASGEGVHGLIGNVYEWVAGYYAPHAPAPGVTVNPHNPTSGTYRVGRGGCAFVGSLTTTSTRMTFNPQFDWG